MSTIQLRTYLTTRTPLRAPFAILVVLLSLLIGAVFGFHQSTPRGVILPGVHIAGIPVSKMQVEEATRLLKTELPKYVGRPVHIMWDNGEEYLYPSDTGIYADVDAMVQRAVQLGREGNLFKQLSERWRIRRKGYHIPLRVKGDIKFDRYLKKLTQQINRPPINARIELESNNQVQVIPGHSGLLVDFDKLRHDVLNATTLPDRDVNVPVRVAQPDITASDIRSWGIQTVVARFSTHYKTTDANRTHNLRIAAQALDGAVIAPGASFSFNKRVGPRAANSGYKEAPVVLNGELVPDIGGGVCQVSTTLYGATLLAGLRIDSRLPHTIPSSYVPLGQDAAVAYDYKDFRFTNNTSHYLYVKAWLEGNMVRVTLLGTNEAPKVRIVSKVEEVIPFPVKEVRDPALPAGQRVIDHKGGKGYVVTTWRVSGDAGDEKWQKIAQSSYKPRPQVLRVGSGSTKVIPAADKTSASALVTPRNPQG